MTKRNPYTTGFGKIPAEFIGRNTIIDSIEEALTSEVPDEQAFKLTGMRGTGKTVTLTAIERRFRENRDFIVIELSCGDNILTDLAAELYSEVPSITRYVDANLNLSVFGIGLNLSGKSPIVSINSAISKLLTEIRKQKKRLLILMDEVRKTEALVEFIRSFQIYVRNELPIYLVVAGLYEDIESIENSDGITFFLRATKFEMTPLNIMYIRDSYRKHLSVSMDVALEYAVMTKGYAFAYQVLGKYLWDAKEKKLSRQILNQFDETLSEKVYKKIWSELTAKDKYFIQFIVRKDKIPVSELLDAAGQSHSSWSVPRKRLRDKGIIDTSTRGEIQILLPRFKEFVEVQILLDGI